MMLCSNCGKNIPFTGNVCPYCHKDKTKDQNIQVLGVLGGLVGLAPGWFIGGAAVVVVPLLGMIAGIGLGYWVSNKA